MLLEIAWDDGSITVVDRRRTVGSSELCDKVVRDLAPVELLLEPAAGTVLIENVAGGPLAIGRDAVIGRRAVAAGSQISSGAAAGAVQEAPATRMADGSTGKLSKRQTEVLAGMADGLNAPEMGEKLGLSANTIRAHTQALYRALGVNDRIDAVKIGFANGLLPDRRAIGHMGGVLELVIASYEAG